MASLGTARESIPAERRLRTGLRRAAFCALALFIALGPMFPQVFGVRSPAFRPWTMFSGVGVGILKGNFRIEEPQGQVRELAPLELLGLERYPRIRHFHFEHRVRDADDLRKFAAGFCAGLEPGARLSFDGHVGTRNGWRPLAGEDLCGGGNVARD